MVYCTLFFVIEFSFLLFFPFYFLGTPKHA
jgi:hypothetical protein